jgi:hypothetical protein
MGKTLACRLLRPVKVMAASLVANMRGYCVLLVALPFARAHGAMQWPPSWFDAHGATGWAPGGFALGAFWFSNWTFIPGNPTISRDSYLRTFPKGGAFSATPWNAPGTAPLSYPCGVDGGNPIGCPPGAKQDPGSGRQECPGGGWGWGYDALQMEFPDAVSTDWRAGTVVEVAWGIKANHGGGAPHSHTTLASRVARPRAL